MSSQTVIQDSLSGFDLDNCLKSAHEHGCYAQEAKFFVKKAQRDYIKSKFGLSGPVPATKFNPSTIMSAPCVDEDFETVSTGTLSSSAWVAQMSNNTSGSSVPCATTAVTYSSNNTYALVVTTPVTDVLCGNVATSPFGGSNILSLNRNNFSTVPSRVAQTFSVTGSNFIYNYAYKGVINANGGHSCCEQPTLIFNFYDCSNALINAMSRTIFSATCATNPDGSFWTSSSGIHYTPNWVIHSLNLSSYIGSCVTAEVIATGCIYTGHEGYLYYDALCTNTFSPMYVNGTFATTYSTCTQNVLLAYPSGLSTYSWQGPPGSGVSGSTVSAVSTSVSGNYSVTATTGTSTISQTMSLTILGLPSISISAASPTVCYGEAMTLFALSPSQNTYTWTGGANGNSISVSPSVASVYSVTGQNLNGCRSVAFYTLNVYGPLNVVVTGPSSICDGASATLTAITNTAPATYLWSSGGTGSVTVVTPSVASDYTVTTTTAWGCSKSATQSISVLPVPAAQASSSSSTLCAGSWFTLTAGPAGGIAYWWTWPSQPWNPNMQTLMIQPPLGTTIFTVTVTGVNGCTASAATGVTVYPVPTVSLVPSFSVFCVGEPMTLTAIGTGIVSYSWSLGALTPTPGTSVHSFTPGGTITQYHTHVANIFGCKATTQVYPPVYAALNDAVIYADSYYVCPGDPVTLNVTGSILSNFLWSTGDTLQVITVNPFSTTSYSVLMSGAYGCPERATYTVVVFPCDFVGMHSNFLDPELTILPNPSGVFFVIKSNTEITLTLYNSLGQLVRQLAVKANEDFRVDSLKPGVYYLFGAGRARKIIIDY
jgi:hypothetical protein